MGNHGHKMSSTGYGPNNFASGWNTAGSGGVHNHNNNHSPTPNMDLECLIKNDHP